MGSVLLDGALSLVATAQGVMRDILEQIPEDKMCHSAYPGTNHALWVAGHIASVDTFLMRLLGGEPTAYNPEWEKLFGMGSVISNDPADYPPAAEVKDVQLKQREELIAFLKTLPEEQLTAPAPEPFGDMALNQAVMINSIAWHQGMHTGQLTTVHRSLGFDPLYKAEE